MKKRSVTEFFRQDKPAHSSYDNLRKIPSYIDGLKVSQRKLIWTAFAKAFKDYVKTETFVNLAALYTNYMHGAASLGVVCEGLTQEFVNAANWAYFDGGGTGWGCRQIPVASATRYTKLKLSKAAMAVFDKADEMVLEKQFFEGEYIEPKVFVPVFPAIFLNPSEGLSTGFSSKIWSRDPKAVISYIRKKLSGTERPRCDLRPWFRNFKGQVRKTEDGTYECLGAVTCKNTTTYEITELPVGADYAKYIEQLDAMVEDKAIASYVDECDPKTNSVLFKIRTTREFTRKHPDEDSLLKAFKLIKSLPENLNCIDENNCVREFKSVEEILDAFIDVRLKTYGKRKSWLLKELKSNAESLVAKFVFCKAVIDGKVVVTNRKKADIEAQLAKVDKVFKKDGSYDWLLSMPVHSLSIEKMGELKRQIDEVVARYNAVKAKDEKTMWEEDLKKFERFISA